MPRVLLHICRDLGRVAVVPVGKVERDEHFEPNLLGGLVRVGKLSGSVAVDVGVVKGKSIDANFHGIRHVRLPVGNRVVLHDADLDLGDKTRLASCNDKAMD